MRHAVDGVLLVTEHRERPVRMRHHLPRLWAERAARLTLTPLWAPYRSSPDTPSATTPVRYRCVGGCQENRHRVI